MRTVIDDLLDDLKGRDRSWRYKEIQDLLMVPSTIKEAMKKMLGFSREFCQENIEIQNEVCMSIGLFENVEQDLKENPGKIFGYMRDLKLLKVMNDLHTKCGCRSANLN